MIVVVVFDGASPFRGKTRRKMQHFKYQLQSAIIFYSIANYTRINPTISIQT